MPPLIYRRRGFLLLYEQSPVSPDKGGGMSSLPEFRNWLIAAQALDWSRSQRQASALLAFAWLQQACQRSRGTAAPTELYHVHPEGKRVPGA